jgi:hypothetical protein
MPGDTASDLPPELIQRIDSMHERLGQLDYFVILGLTRAATRAQVRQAFLTLAPQYHPDKYFGRNLGAYGQKMDRVFAQLSAAHDTLVDDERRAAYVRGLPPEAPPPPPTPAPAPGSDRPAMHAAPPAKATDAAAAAAARARQQAFAAKLAGPNRIGTPMPGRIGTPMPGRAGTPMPGTVPRGPTPARAFEALRRPSSPGMPAVDPQAAVEALKRRYEESVAQSRGTTQSRGLAQAAQAAASKTQQQAEAVAKAKDAEGKQDYADAGTHWAHAFDLLPAGDTAHRASVCFRRGGDLRRAARYGDEAVKLDAHKANYHLNLALIYADLGMGVRARGEIERAHTLDPQSAQVKEAIIRIKAMK